MMQTEWAFALCMLIHEQQSSIFSGSPLAHAKKNWPPFALTKKCCAPRLIGHHLGPHQKNGSRSAPPLRPYNIFFPPLGQTKNVGSPL